MDKAKFQFISYHFPKFSFNIGNSPSAKTSEEDDGVEVKFSASGVYDEQEMTYQLLLGVMLYGNDESIISEVECVAEFKFNEHTRLETIPEFFYPNCIAIVYPYIRSFLSLITTQSNNRGIILPTWNLTSLGNGLKEKTVRRNGADHNTVSSN